MARKKQQEDDAELSPLGGSVEGPSRVQPIDIQQKVFKVSFRGYDEREVDQFLDLLTEEMSVLHEENRKLRLQGGGGDLSEAARQADEIRRRAREDADQIMRDARARSAVAGVGATAAAGSSEAVAVNAFLGQEREFLQSLASLINDHAESVKSQVSDLRSARSKPSASPAEPSSDPAGGSALAEQQEAESGSQPVPGSASGAVEAPRSIPDVANSAWEATAKPRSGDKGTGEEPSLRELFWGEE
jgi:DivIVA domain-containing protein